MGKPGRVTLGHPYTNKIVYGREPGELKHLSSRRKRKQHVISGVAASETGRAQTGRRESLGVRTVISTGKDNRTVLGKPAVEGESPVREIQARQTGSRVPRDTGNLVGRCGDHPVRLNTTQ